MYGLKDSDVPWLLFYAFVIYVVIPVALILLVIRMVTWIFRAANKNKKSQLQEPSGNEQVRCLGCGAAIDSKQQSCQKCGWTWK